MILTLIVRSRLLSSTMLPFLVGSVARLAASGSGNRSAEALCGPGPGLGCLGGAIARGGGSHESIDETPRDLEHLIDGSLESRLVGLGRRVHAGELADELQGGGADLVVGGGGFEIE